MKKYLNKITGQIVTAFQLTKGDIEAIIIAGGQCDAIDGDFMIISAGKSSACGKKNFELNFKKAPDPKYQEYHLILN